MPRRSLAATLNTLSEERRRLMLAYAVSSCVDKTRFDTEKSAVNAAKRLARNRRGRRMRAFYCKFCRHYHVGYTAEREAAYFG
jgi:hypothetical protein